MSASPDQEPDIRRHAIRLGGAYLLDMVAVATEAVDHDLIATMILLAIGRDNVKTLTESGQARAEYAGLDAIPPDSLRQPVSVYAVARDLGMPYETVRRHVAKLTKAGKCERVAQGVVIPTSLYARPAMKLAIVKNWDLTLGFLRALADVGMVRAAEPADAVDQRRQVTRLATDFFLEEMSMLGKSLGLDPANALLYVGVVRANTWHVTTDPKLSMQYAALGSVPPDELRRPVSVYAMARSLRIPYETTRRYANRLEDIGLCERLEGGGLVVPARVHALPKLMAGTAAYWETASAYVDRLAAIGVTASST